MYTPNAMLPDFAQSPGKDPDLLEAIPCSDRAGVLKYRDPETGQTWTVPSIWYNQPRETQAQVQEWYAEQHDEMARRYLRNDYLGDAENANALAEKCRANAARIRAELAALKAAHASK